MIFWRASTFGNEMYCVTAGVWGCHVATKTLLGQWSGCLPLNFAFKKSCVVDFVVHHSAAENGLIFFQVSVPCSSYNNPRIFQTTELRWFPGLISPDWRKVKSCYPLWSASLMPPSWECYPACQALSHRGTASWITYHSAHAPYW